MRVSISENLPRPPRDIWSRVRTMDFILNMSDPFLRYELVSPSPQPAAFENNANYTMVGKLFRVLTVDKQRVRTEMSENVGHDAFLIRNISKGFPMSWDHRIELRQCPDGSTTYRDYIDVSAGLLTPLAYLMTRIVFTRRRRNWRSEFAV